MKYLATTAGMLLLSSLPLTACAQEMGYLDLTDNVFRGSSRQTRGGGGVCGGGSSHSRQRSEPEVTVTVVSLDRNRYQLGEEVTFEIRVLNSGNKAIIVPWTPHLGDVEPADEHTTYKYRVGVVEISFSDPEGLHFSIFENLYGLKNAAGSFRKLLPTQWFTVKGRKKLDIYDQRWGRLEFADSGFVETKVTASYRQDTGTYSPNDGGSHSLWCVPLSCKKANQFDVILERP